MAVLLLDQQVSRSRTEDVLQHERSHEFVFTRFGVSMSRVPCLRRGLVLLSKRAE